MAFWDEPPVRVPEVNIKSVKYVPRYINDSINTPYLSGSYACKYLLYQSNKRSEKMNKDMIFWNSLYEDWTNETPLWMMKIPCSVNINSACFANFGHMYRRMDTGGKRADRLLLYLSKSHLGDINGKIGVKEQIDFLYSMKKGRCLPKYLKLPKRNWKGKSSLFFDIKIDKIQAERLYFYLCTLRSICEHPRVVVVTNNLIKNQMEPLSAFIFAHLFTGTRGHSVLGFTNVEDSRNYRFINSIETPISVKDAIRLTIACRKVLVQSHGPYIYNEGHTYWNMESKLSRIKKSLNYFSIIQDVNYENLNQLSPKDLYK